MKRTLLSVSIFIFFVVSNLSAANIYTLIKQGYLKEASDSLSLLSTAGSRDGNNLFFLSLIEQDAERSARLMEAALNAAVSATFRQEIYYRLAQFHFHNKNYSRLAELVKDYQSKWESGKFRSQIKRMAIYLEELNKDYEKAIRNTDRYLLEYNKASKKHWGMIDKARIMKKFNKSVAAHKMLRDLSREDKGAGIPLALYLLTDEAINKNRTDDAVFFYNILREGYPSAVGLDAIVDRIGGMSTSSDRDNTAEKRTGVSYTIKVGVFSVKDNAKKQADKFKVYGKKVDIKKKKISNKEYYVVIVGDFTSYEKAHKFKNEIETNSNEAYQVVIR